MDPHPSASPMPIRLWELILVQVTFALAAGIYATHLSWMSEPPTVRWTLALLCALRTSVVPLVLEDFAIGERARWNVGGRICLLFLVLADLGRIPSFALFERRVFFLDAVLGIPALLLGLAALRSGGRWMGLWRWLPLMLLLAHPTLAWMALRRW